VAARLERGERGFTVVEVLIALLVLLIGLAGILSMQFTSVRANSFSRHATEATILAEDKMEDLRATPTAALVPSTDQVDALGKTGGPLAIYTRVWTLDTTLTPIPIKVEVSWQEGGGTLTDNLHSIVLKTQRAP
jgi:prepilin-type N-terminal cleavage/methylation domain-containing protein